jgi:two-component system, NtrC family, sensor kinase
VIYNEPSCSTAACHEHPAEQRVLGVVDVGVSLADADLRVTRNTRYAVGIGALSTVAICGLVALFIHRYVSRPVGRLLECTRKVAHGDLECSICPASNDEIGHLAESFRGMTEDLRVARKELGEFTQRLEEEVARKTDDLKVAQAQIVRSEKLSSLGLLAAGVAHELNSPLMGILTFAQLLMRKAPEQSAQYKDLEVIVRQTERCSKIIRQLLDFSRENPVEIKLLDIHAVLQQAIDLVEHQALFHNIEIRRAFQTDLPPLRIDANGMQQVFLNLLINAGEAMPSGGCVVLRTGAAGPGAIKIVFDDTGSGIPPENLSRIFDPFFTSKDVGHGTGLGLAVTYGIVERHGGTIEVESTVGVGTTFTITLPAESAASPVKEST